MQSKRFACSLLAIASAGLIGYAVLAQAGAPAHRHDTADDGRNIATQLDQNKMTLAKAVEAAEEHSNGRAISAMTQIDRQGHMALHVWCVAGDPAGPPKIMKCYVDLASGKVAGMKEVHEFPIPSHEQGGDQHAMPDHAAPDHAPHAGGARHEGAGAARTITNQTVEAACGACIYNMSGVTGCPLAVKIDGKA